MASFRLARCGRAAPKGGCARQLLQQILSQQGEDQLLSRSSPKLQPLRAVPGWAPAAGTGPRSPPGFSRAGGWLVPVTQFGGKIKRGMCPPFPGPWRGRPQPDLLPAVPGGAGGPVPSAPPAPHGCWHRSAWRWAAYSWCSPPACSTHGIWSPENSWAFGPLQNPALRVQVLVQQRCLQTRYKASGRREKVNSSWNVAARGGKPGTWARVPNP